MRTRTLTVASFFSVAMAATLLGALYTSQVRRPEPAQASTVPTAAEAQPTFGHGGFDTFRDIARAVNPGVVNINTSKVVKLPRYRDPFRDFFGDDSMDRFFGQPAPEGQGGERRQTQTSLGSGFVIDKDGYILTNRHVIEGADQVDVTFPGGKRYEAKIVGQDARTDVALIKIEPKGPLSPLPLGDSIGRRGRRVGDGGGQPLRPARRRQQRHGGRRLVHRSRPAPGRGARHVRGDDPDRRRHQPRQLRRPAASTRAARSSASTR